MCKLSIKRSPRLKPIIIAYDSSLYHKRALSAHDSSLKLQSV